MLISCFKAIFAFLPEIARYEMSNWPWPSSKDEYFICDPVVIVLPNNREIDCPDGIPFDGFGTSPGVWGRFVSCQHDDSNPDWDNLLTWRVSPEEPQPYVRLSSGGTHLSAMC